MKRKIKNKIEKIIADIYEPELNEIELFDKKEIYDRSQHFYMTVEKIDYYTWKIMAIMAIICYVILLYAGTHTHPKLNNLESGQLDNYWHQGYMDCEKNFNLTSDEKMALNVYRISKIEMEANNGSKDS